MTDDLQDGRRPAQPAADDFAGSSSKVPNNELVETAPLTVNVELQKLSGVVGRYNVVAWLGGGGFGDVYKAWDDELRRDVALKVLKGNADTKTSDALLAEARLLAQLDHPAIVPVYDIGRTDTGHVFIVSKYVQGSDLARLLRRERLGARKAVELVARIAEALAYAHDRGIIHRDVKPGNILVHPDGMPVLADFGLAMRETDFGRGSRSPGTPMYMSPEQARGEGHRVDGRSDVYSLGTVLYELLTGSTPFRASTVPEVLDCIRNVDVRPPRQIDHDLPKELDRVCLRALARRASDRYSTASDMADDLRHWLSSFVTVPTKLSAEQSHPAAVDSRSSQRTADVVVVPRGLRPFEAGDADFFLHLLPGPRDRHGIPDSVQFWKSRIEDTDPDTTFRVGLLLGPSGSGKSSLVRAGVLPRLDEKVLIVFLEARSDDLEHRLAERIHRRIPGLPLSGSLRELLALVRQRRGLPDGRKLLIVVDQFEQWLNLHDPQIDGGITEALRQCDGTTIQTLLLVRDDFTYAATRFMEVLEEPLLQNRNFATVDLFGVDHARRVLAAFGRSYGAVSDPASREHQRFIETAVADLAHDGRVIPVQLAIFAEMVKDKPWSAATLRDLGGMSGIGIGFLEDRLAGPSAHPLLRANLPIVRRLLETLLPENEVAIKGPAKTRAELLQAVAATADQELLDKLLGLLDTEIRLITPTGGDSLSSHDSGSGTRESKYQLSHDYLVPAIRDWLSAEQRSTRKGRVRIRLRELAQTWSAKPDPRRLPTFFEWATIRVFTRGHEWSPSQRRMMLAAGSRIRRSAAIMLVVLMILAGLGREWNGRIQANVVRDRLLNFKTTELSPVLRDVTAYSRWITPLLAQDRAELDERRESLSELERNQRFHLALAGMPRDPAELQFVLDQVPHLHADEVPVVASLLKQLGDATQDNLWQRFQTALEASSPDALYFGAILARNDSDNEAWKRNLRDLARLFAAERPTHLSQWINLYEPIGGRLATVLAQILQAGESVTAREKTNISEAIAAFAMDDTSTLVAATQHAQLVDLSALITAMQRQEPASRTELRRRLIALNDAGRPVENSAEVPTSLRARVDEYSGYVDSHCALTQTLPFDDWEKVLKEFSVGGYRPVSVRPYRQGDRLLIAAAWQRDARRTETRSNIVAESLTELDRQMQASGLRIGDLASYRPTDDAAKPMWIGVWVEPTDASVESRVYANLPLSEHERNEYEWSKAAFSLERLEINSDHAGEPTCMAIWEKTSKAQNGAFSLHRYARAFGDLAPGSLQTDCRFTSVPNNGMDRFGLWNELIDNMKEADDDSSAKNSAYKWLLVAKYRSAIGDFSEAARILDAHKSAMLKYALFHEYAGVLHARTGNQEALRKDIEAYRQFKTTRAPGMLEYLELRQSLLADDEAKVTEQLNKLQQVSDATEQPAQKSETIELVARATAIIAAKFATGESAATWNHRAIEQLRRTVVEAHVEVPEWLVFDVDFDGLRNRPEFQQLLRELGLHQRFTSSYVVDASRESRQLFNLTTAEHVRAAVTLRREGFHPVAMTVRSESSENSLQCCSVWHRSVVPIEQRVKSARARCNLILSLAYLGETDALMDGLQNSKDRELQSQLVASAASLVSPAVFVKALRDTAATERASMLLAALAGYSVEKLAPVDRSYLEARLPELASSANDAQTVSTATLCLKKWDLSAPATTEAKLEPSRNWYRNLLGQTMIVVTPPERHLMGSPKWEVHREESEFLHWVRINGRYALSATEVTQAQFAEFMKDDRFKRLSRIDSYDIPTMKQGLGDVPQAGIHWFHAAAFCQWLSEHEGLPEADWCYPSIWNLEDKTSLALPNAYRLRCGYRLPSEMEWEWAARGGATEARHCGSDEAVLSQFEWIAPYSQGRSHSVGTLRPNALGFFDMLGNVHEWCDDRQESYHRPFNSDVRADSPGKTPPSTSQPKNVARGGCYSKTASEARSANREFQWSDYHHSMLGFRVARTMPSSE